MSIFTALMIIFVVSVVVAGATFSLYTFMFPERTASDRLESMIAAAETKDQVADITGHRDPSMLEKITANLGRYAQAANDDATETLRKLLKQAGFRNRRAVDIYNGTRVACAMLFPVAVSPLAFFFKTTSTAFAMVVAMALGYYGPGVYLQNEAQKRQGELLKSFPDALDLLVSCVESGLSLDQSFRRVAHELQTVAPILAREFTMVNSEIGAGVERMIALKHLEERTGLEEVRSLVNMLGQAERFGTSVADSLRIYSNVARERRTARAEEKAGQVGSKLTIVMIVFFLPVLMAILMAPSGIRMFSED